MNKKFQRNNKYLTISIYTITVIIISTIFFRLIINWEETLKVINKFFHALSPFLLGFLIAYMVNPFINFLYSKVLTKILKIKNRKSKKTLSIFIAYLIVLSCLVICLRYVIPQVIQSLDELVNTQIPAYYDKLTKWVATFSEENPNFDSQRADSILNEILPHVIEYAKNIVSELIPMLYTFSISVIKLIFNILIAIIISIYMSTDKIIIKKYCKKIIYAFFPEEKANTIIDTLKECHAIFCGFIVGKFIDSLIIGLLCFGLMTVFSLDYAVLISIIVGITNMIPYFGPFIGAVPGILIIAMINPFDAVIFTILIIVLQQFDGWILGPKILSNSTGLRPIGILFAITIGGAYAGPLGMFLGVPLFGVICHLFDKFVVRHLNQRQLDIDMDGEIITITSDYQQACEKEEPDVQ